MRKFKQSEWRAFTSSLPPSMLKQRNDQSNKNAIISQNEENMFSNIEIGKQEEHPAENKVNGGFLIASKAFGEQMIQKEENAAENILTATIRADWMADHKKQANQYLMMAHFKAILQDYPEMINQSIDYLTGLAENSQISTFARKPLTRDSIAQYFTDVFMKGSSFSFYTLSKTLLNNRLLQIIRNFHESQPHHTSSPQIKIQIFAYFLKTASQFQQYVPKCRSILDRKTMQIARTIGLESKVYSQLKHIHSKHFPFVNYIEQNLKIHTLVNAYYLIFIKFRMLELASLKLPDLFDKIVEQLQKNKVQAIQAKSSYTQFYTKHSLSELYAKRYQVYKQETGSGKERKETGQIQQAFRLSENENRQNSSRQKSSSHFVMSKRKTNTINDLRRARAKLLAHKYKNSTKIVQKQQLQPKITHSVRSNIELQ